jgi:hypothetical protein
VHLDATPEEVWDALARFDRISRWAEEVEHSSYLTGQTEGVGTARRVQVGRTVLVERVTEWDPPRALAYAIEGLPPVVGGAANRWVLRPDGTGTTVTLTATVDPGAKPPGRLVAPLLARRLSTTNEGLLAGLADHLRGAKP